MAAQSIILLEAISLRYLSLFYVHIFFCVHLFLFMQTIKFLFNFSRTLLKLPSLKDVVKTNQRSYYMLILFFHCNENMFPFCVNTSHHILKQNKSAEKIINLNK
jgi:hypothetical protein